jgi:hypothetical protein
MILQNFGQNQQLRVLRKSFPVGHEKEGDSLLYLVRQRAYGSQKKLAIRQSKPTNNKSRCFDRRRPAAGDTDSVSTSKRSSCFLLNRLPSGHLWPRNPSMGSDLQQIALAVSGGRWWPSWSFCLQAKMTSHTSA